MREETERQPLRRILILGCAILLGCAAPLAAGEHAQADARDELRALKTTEMALIARLAAASEFSAPDRAAIQEHRRSYERLIAQFPRDAAIHNAYGEFLWAVYENADAMEQWKLAHQLDPRSAAPLFHLGECQYALGDMGAAGRYFEEAAALAPKNPLYQFHLGNVLFTFRRENRRAGEQNDDAVLDRALGHLRLATQLAPRNEDFARGYAETFYGMPHPDWEQASAAWEHYLGISAQKDFAYANLARVNIRLGRMEKARGWLDKIEDKGFDRLKARLLKQIEKQEGSRGSAPKPQPHSATAGTHLGCAK